MHQLTVRKAEIVKETAGETFTEKRKGGEKEKSEMSNSVTDRKLDEAITEYKRIFNLQMTLDCLAVQFEEEVSCQ